MIIKSMLDNDFYKFTMQAAVLAYPRGRSAPVRYTFINRRPEGRFNDEFARALGEEIRAMSRLALTADEAKWLAEKADFLGPSYIEYLRNYRYHTQEVSFSVQGGELQLFIEGPWERTILWEVPLMAMISELFFTHCDTNWTMESQPSQMEAKARRLQYVTFGDFGTRRRRNYETQNLIVAGFQQLNPTFVGTSNVHLAHKYNIRPLGTQAHEWYMGVSALEGLRRANYYGMKIWSEIFQGRLGTALPDTFGTDAFFEDFDHYFARLFDGVRHDSGNPFTFAGKTIDAYRKLKIKPQTRTILFSDNLNCDLVTDIQTKLEHEIGVSFGVGTHFTNDFPGSPALNMVIKMASCNGVPVVKISDEPSKQLGDRDALRVANWTFNKIPLDGKTNG